MTNIFNQRVKIEHDFHTMIDAGYLWEIFLLLYITSLYYN